MIKILERLVAARIRLLPDTGFSNHFVFERDGFAALVERKGEEFGSIGAPGLLTDHGLAMLVWRDAEPWFVRKGFETQATSEQVGQIRSFSADLTAALHK